MKKTVFFSFCLIMAMFICGAIHACAEREAVYDVDAKTATYSETELSVPRSGTVYFAIYRKNQLISISEKSVERGNDTVSVSTEAKAKFDSGKVFMFNQELYPMSEPVFLDRKDDFLVIEDSVIKKTVTKNFESYDEAQGIFGYYKDMNDARLTNLYVEKDAEVYYNGSLVPQENIAYLGGLEHLLVETADSITFTCPQNGTGRFDKIYVTDYAYRQVTAVNTNEQSVKFTTGGNICLDPEKRENPNFIYHIYDADGNAMSLRDVKEDDIFNIVAPLHNGLMQEFDDVPYMDIYISRETVVGTVEEEIERDYRYSINGKLYTVDNNASIRVGDEGVFYLTIDGKIYDSDTISALRKNCAFIAAYGSETSFGVNTHLLQLFADNKVLDYTVARTLRVYDQFDDGTSCKYFKRLDGTQDAFFENIAALVADETTADAAMAKLGRRLVTFKLNSDNEIMELRFAVPNSDFSAIFREKAKYVPEIHMFGAQDLDENSKLFVAPVSQVGNNQFNVNNDDLRTGPFAALDADKAGGYRAYLYSFDRCDGLGAALVCETVDLLVNNPDYDPDTDDTTISKNCSFIVAYGSETSFGVNTHLLQLFADNKVLDYTVARTLRVYDRFDDGTSCKYFKRSDGTQDAFFENIAALVANETTAEAAMAKLGRRLVTFKLNSDNEIMELRFAAPNSDFSAIFREKAKYVPEIHLFGAQDLDENSKLFAAPVSQVVNNQFNVNKDDLRTGPFAALDADKAGGYRAYLYSFDRCDGLGAALVCETVDLLVNNPDYDLDTDDTTISKNCSFIMDYSHDTGFVPSMHMVKLLIGNGNIKVYSIAPTLKVYSEFDGEYTRKIVRRTDGTQDTFFEEIAALVADETTPDAAKAKLGRRMVTFKVNFNDEISELRFASANEAFSVASNSNAVYDAGAQTFGGQKLDENSKLFAAPVTMVKNACYNVDENSLRIVPYASVLENVGYSAFLYRFAEDTCLAAALVDKDVEGSMKNAHLAVVKMRSMSVDTAGNDVDKYTFVQSSEIISKSVAWDSMDKVKAMNTGDVFCYVLNSDGEIEQTHLIYNAKTRAFDPGIFSYRDYNSNQFAILYGKVTQVISGRMTIAGSYQDDLTFRFDEELGNTYAQVDEAALSGTNKFAAVKPLTGSTDLRESYGSQEYYIITTIGETERYKDCVQIRRN